MHTLRVLVVDDNPLNLELAQVALARDGFEVCTACGAHEALAEWRRQVPHIALIDIQMPEVDGLDLARWLRAEPNAAGVRLVAFTALAMKGDREQLLAAGMDGYIAKPIDVRCLAAQVRELLGV